jgi:hypothetical protein
MFEENKNAQLKIVDVYGKEILSQQVLSKNTKVNTTYLLQGIYFVKVTTDVGSVVKKFIRQ